MIHDFENEWKRAAQESFSEIKPLDDEIRKKLIKESQALNEVMLNPPLPKQERKSIAKIKSVFDQSHNKSMSFAQANDTMPLKKKTNVSD